MFNCSNVSLCNMKPGMCFCRFRARRYFLLRKSRKVQSVMQSLRQNEVKEEMWIQKTMVKSMSHKGHMKTGDSMDSTALSKEKLSAMRSKVHDWDKANALPICKWFPNPVVHPFKNRKLVWWQRRKCMSLS